METSRETQDKLIAHLKEVGWVQRKSFGPNGERCLMSGLGDVARWSETRFDKEGAYWKAYDEMSRKAYEQGYMSVLGFNDKEGRTFEEIVEFLKQ